MRKSLPKKEANYGRELPSTCQPGMNKAKRNVMCLTDVYSEVSRTQIGFYLYLLSILVNVQKLRHTPFPDQPRSHPSLSPQTPNDGDNRVSDSPIFTSAPA